MIVWMLYSALIGVLIAGSARAAESFARMAGFRVRVIWVAALTLTVALSVLALRPTGVNAASPGPAGASVASDASTRRVMIPQLNIPASWDRVMTPSVEGYVALGWVAVSLTLIVVLAATARHLQIARRDWSLMSLHGTDVRVAPHVGPLVMGVTHPEIVVPRWLLERPVEEQQLVVAHEREHVRARDPRLLAAAWTVVVAAPWNIAVWYMWSRLRVAVELDCDARVLRRGAARRPYAALLISVAEHASILSWDAVGLMRRPTQLRERILAIQSSSAPPSAKLRASVTAALALGVVIAACATSVPQVAKPSSTVQEPPWAAMRRQRAEDDTPLVARVADTHVLSDAELAATRHLALEMVNAIVHPGKPDSERPLAYRHPFEGLVLVNGARPSERELQSLVGTRIHWFEYRGASYATTHYPDADAKHGVIAFATDRP